MLRETRGTTFELVRHFAARQFDGEWSSTAGQWQTVAASAFALLLPAGVLLLRSGSADQDRYLRLSKLAPPSHFAPRRDGWGEAKLLYEDLPEGVTDLGIHELSWREHAAE